MGSQEEITGVEVYTTNEPCMAKHVQYKGMILVSKNKYRHNFGDIGSGFKDELLKELREKAVQAGANAIVGLRMETNFIAGGAVDMMAYGTAVYFVR